MRFIWVTWAQWRKTWVKIAYYVVRIVMWTHCISLLCHTKGGKKVKFILKLKKKKKNVFLVVFNQQASVAWCKDFYKNLWFDCGREHQTVAPSELHPSQLRVVLNSSSFYSLLLSLPWDPPHPQYSLIWFNLIKLYCALIFGRVRRRCWQQVSNWCFPRKTLVSWQ